jgi:hypothetical protein
MVKGTGMEIEVNAALIMKGEVGMLMLLVAVCIFHCNR